MAGLFDIHNMDGLFNAAPDTQSMIDRYAAMPPAKKGKGGMFGSGYDGEDIMSMLLRAASIAQGDYGAAAEFGGAIGARARAAAEAAQKEAMRQQQRMEGREDKQWEWATKPQEPSQMEKTLAVWNSWGPEQKQAYAGFKDVENPSYSMIDGNNYRVPRMAGPSGGGGIPPGAIADLRKNPGTAAQFDEASDRLGWGIKSADILGGGVSNDTGNFRFNPPRLRP